MATLPAPRTWTDGEDPDNIPTADNLNLDWRDAFRFFLGIDDPASNTGARPIIFLTSTSALSLATNTATNMPFNNEQIKRGGMTHSNVTNNHLITVPYTGQYQGFAHAGYDTTSTVSTRLIIRLFKTPATPVLMARTENTPQRTSGWSVTMSYTMDLTAGDQVYMTVATVVGTATMRTATDFNSKFAMWYAGDYQ
jgi:hypothetical protein